MLDGWATEILVIVEVARWARDFPTDEMVQALARRYAEWDGFTFDVHTEGIKDGWIERAQGDLEAVRRVMYGET